MKAGLTVALPAGSPSLLLACVVMTRAHDLARTGILLSSVNISIPHFPCPKSSYDGSHLRKSPCKIIDLIRSNRVVTSTDRPRNLTLQF